MRNDNDNRLEQFYWELMIRLLGLKIVSYLTTLYPATFANIATIPGFFGGQTTERVVPVRLGAGAFGTTYRCSLTTIPPQRIVAIKEFGAVADRNQEATAYRNAGQHANILPCHGPVTFNGNPALILEYMSGGDLRGLLNHWWHEISWSSKLAIAQQIANALTHLQGQGWVFRTATVHQDLKSDNVLLDNQLNARLGD